MDNQQIRARITVLRTELTIRLREIDDLLQLLDSDGGSPPGRLHIIHERTAAVTAALGTTARVALHRPRHPIGIAAVAAILGAFTLLLAVPAHITPSGVGYAVSKLHIPTATPALILRPPAITPATSAYPRHQPKPQAS